MEARVPAARRPASGHAVSTQLSTRGIVFTAVCGSVLIAALDGLATGRVGLVFGMCFVIVCVVAALAIKPHDAFTAAVLPPLVFGMTMALLSPFMAARLAPSAATAAQGFLGGLASHAGWLVAAYVVSLTVTAGRSRQL